MKMFHFLILLNLFCFYTPFTIGANAEKLRGVTSKAEDPLKGQISNLSEPNKFFTGREQEITDIKHAFGQDNILVIEGISGIGKTQLAKQYAYASHKKYDLIWWFDADKSMETQIDGLLSEIFRRTNKPYYRPASSIALTKKLQDTLVFMGSNWLLIFDNVEDISTITPYVTLKNTDSLFKHVIVTSKKMNKTYPALMIDKFQRTESLAFLSKILEGETEDDLNELAETLGDFPLALAQAAGYIKANPSVSVRTYIELFKDSHSELWNAEEKSEQDGQSSHVLKDNYSKTISTTIKMNIASIKERSPLAYDLLCFCSLLHYHHIPLELLEHWACSKRGASKLEFHEALSLLLNYFILEQEKGNSSLFTQHELIQFVTDHTFSKATKRTILQDAMECMLCLLLSTPGTLQEQFKRKEHYCNHMEKLSDSAKKNEITDKITYELNLSLLYIIHFIHHDFNRSAQLINALQKLPQHIQDLSPLAHVWLHCTLVNDKIYENFSIVDQNYKMALIHLDKIEDVETQKSYLLHLNIDYADALSNFGRLREAVAFCRNTRPLLSQSANRPQKISFLGMSALINLRYGRYEECLKDLADCFELISIEKDAEKYVPFLMLIKSHCFLYQNYIQEAYGIVEEYYPHLLDVFATPECNILIKAQFIKGGCLAAFGKKEEALNIVQEALEKYEKSPGFDNDILKGMGYRILGEIFEAKNNFVTAHEKYTKAENLYENILQEKTLDDLGRLYTRLAILGAKLGDDTSLNKYLSLHIENFGLAHPRTFEIKKFLDDKGISLQSY